MKPKHLKKRYQKHVVFWYWHFHDFASIFGGSWASKLEPNWSSWAPRTRPKAYKIQSFGSMCPRYFPRGSNVAPTSVPRRAQKSILGGISIDLGIFFHYFWLWKLISSQPKLQMSYVLAEWRYHLKSTYLQTSSHMSKEGRRYVRSTENFTEKKFWASKNRMWGIVFFREVFARFLGENGEFLFWKW